MDNKICFLSYNSRGFNESKRKFCFDISNFSNSIPTILCNQENFLLKGNTYLIKQCLPNHEIFFKPAIKEYIQGRGKNGMFVAVPRSLNSVIQDISPTNFRIQALTLSCDTETYLILNTYFPCDNNSTIENDELIEILVILKSLIETTVFNHLIIAGDINCDFSRNSTHVRLIHDFVHDLSLSLAIDSYPFDFTAAQERNGITTLSTIDHFMWNQTLNNSILDSGVIHNVDNLSNHSPIYLILHKTTSMITSPHNVNSIRKRKPIWKKANSDEKNSFLCELDDKLSNLQIPTNLTSCYDLNCNCLNHRQMIDDFTFDVLYTLDNVAEKCLVKPIPTHNNVSNRPNIPGWSDMVKPFRDDAIFWNSIWKSANKPINCELHNIMKRTRNLYHYKLRKCRRTSDTIKKSKLLDACFNGNANVFDEIKRMRHTKNNITSNIDGKTEHIEQHFKNIYSDLYNKIDDNDEVNQIYHELNSSINNSMLSDVYCISPALVKEATKKLKVHKNDPYFNYNSDCFINAPESLYHKLSIIFQSMVSHGYVPQILLVVTLIPIIKDKLASPTNSSNYRSVAICSLVMKIFDWILILLYGELLSFDELQFAYQKKTSTTMCTWVVSETIDYFLRNDSDVFACMMDMTKAFDLVKHGILFRKLIDRGIPPVYIRLTIFIYRNQKSNVLWGNIHSDSFSIHNGVRQGAVISAIFYCIYINDLYKVMRNKKTGCWIEGKYFGIIGYSDDNILLSPTQSGLQEMIETCNEFASINGLKFSTNIITKKSKTKCIAFTKRKNCILHQLKLNDNILPWVEKATFLGNNFDTMSKGMENDIKVKRGQFIQKCMEINQEFYFTTGLTKLKINSLYNLSLTGSPLWNLFSHTAVSFEKTWNVAIRNFLNLPRETHKFFIEPLSHQLHLKFILWKRLLNFVQQLSNSNKNIVRHLLFQIKFNVLSTTGYNLKKIQLLLNKNSINDLQIKDITNMVYNYVPEIDSFKIDFLSDVLDIIDNCDYLNFEDQMNFKKIRDYLATS